MYKIVSDNVKVQGRKKGHLEEFNLENYHLKYIFNKIFGIRLMIFVYKKEKENETKFLKLECVECNSQEYREGDKKIMEKSFKLKHVQQFDIK